MRNWNVIAISCTHNEQLDIIEAYGKKSEATKRAKRILASRGDLYEAISIHSDNGSEIDDDSVIYFKK